MGHGSCNSLIIPSFLTSEDSYRVFDNDVKKVGAYFSDKKSLLELKTGVKISLSLVHFYKYMSNKEKNKLRFWMATPEKLLIFRCFVKIH